MQAMQLFYAGKIRSMGDWHYPFTHSRQKCNLFCNKLIQYIFYNIWGLSTHVLQVFNNCSSCTYIIQCRVTPPLFIEKAFKVIISHQQ